MVSHRREAPSLGESKDPKVYWEIVELLINTLWLGSILIVKQLTLAGGVSKYDLENMPKSL